MQQKCMYVIYNFTWKTPNADAVKQHKHTRCVCVCAKVPYRMWPS